MNHQEKVRQFFELISPEQKIVKPGIFDRWLWSLGYTTPPSVVWPLWAFMLDVMIILLVIRPVVLILFIFLLPKNPQAPFLMEYWHALTDPRDTIALFGSAIICVYGFYTWYFPWRRWRQLWKKLDQNRCA